MLFFGLATAAAALVVASAAPTDGIRTYCEYTRQGITRPSTNGFHLPVTPLKVPSNSTEVAKRTIHNISGDHCFTTCTYQPPTEPLNGPNEADCVVIAQNFWNNGGTLLNLAPYTSYTMAYHSCEVLL